MILRKAAWSLISACALATQNAHADLTTDPGQIDEIIRENSLAPPLVLDDKHFWLDLAARSDWALVEAGFQAGLGYRVKFFGFDARVSAGKTQYQGIRTAPGASQSFDSNLASADPASQLNYPRNGNDPWSYFLLEPGLSVSARLFAQALPWLTERARVGFAWGRFNDVGNDLPFTAYLFTVEASLICRLGEQSPWSVTASLSWDTGALVAKGLSGEPPSFQRLPVNWVGDSLGLQYSF